MLNLVREVLAVYHPTVNFHIIFLKDVAFALIKKKGIGRALFNECGYECVWFEVGVSQQKQDLTPRHSDHVGKLRGINIV